ncbi:MAG: ComEA family DNA-binding protein [Tepidimonas sp.]|uniref:ComEA family DNA-binding protein n=1 Tax=Tepidimonas sp. TaxID=2002775 RepID=UPI004054F6E0
MRCMSRLVGLVGVVAAALGWAMPVEVNQASVSELQALHGVGLVLAQRIVHARTQQAFSDWEDLQRRVPGLGPKTTEKLSQQGLRVQGKRYGSEQHQPGSPPYPYIPGLSAPRP